MGQKLDKQTRNIDRLTHKVDQLADLNLGMGQKLDKQTQNIDHLTQKVDQQTTNVDKLVEVVGKLAQR
jgi:t-SNARE complex subunit (syntaxin)